MSKETVSPVDPPLQRQIGEWRADRTTNELRRGHVTVRVEPKAMEVLMALADRAGQVVSREELLAAAWPGVVVGDDALTQSVIKLRKALSDRYRSPSYIETISKRGYRLIAPVCAAGSMAGAGAPETDGASLSRAASRAHMRWPALAAVTALAALTAGLHSSDTLTTGAVEGAVGDPFTAGPDDRQPWVTLTVLPFEAVGRAGDDYLARGISSDLMTDLARLSGARVLRASSRDGKAAAPGARYVVSGTVQRDGSTLRVNVRLIDTRTHEQLWSRRFERPYADLLAVQNEIGRSLTEQLPGTITEVERRRLARRYTNSLEAYDAFLRAQALFLVRTPNENGRARALYAKAVELDPKFARAYAGLAMTHAMEYRYKRSAELSSALKRAFDLAETARLIDPDLPDVYWALGFVHTQSRRHEQAIESLQKAIALNRSYADAYALMGGIYTYLGQPERSVPLVRTALRFNPDGGYLYYLLLGRAYLFQNDVEQALINLREAQARNADDMETHVYLAAAYAAGGDVAAAEWEAEEVRAREARFSVSAWLDTYPMTSERQKAALSGLLAKAKL